MRRDPRVYLLDVDQAAGRIADYVSRTDLEGFLTDYLLQDGIQHQLTILGEALNKLKHEAPAVAARIPDLPDAIGLRHHVVHGYDTIQLRMIWETAEEHVPLQRRCVRSVLAELDREAPTPDRRLEDDALLLSCAVSERVDAADPVHRDSLRLDIEEVLRSSSLVTHVREEEVDKIASGIARKRAETEVRIEAVRAADADEIFQVRARFDGDPDYSEQEDIDAYNASLDEGMRRLDREPPEASEIERSVARAVVATRGKKARHGLPLAMKAALELGTPDTADEIRKERTALLAELQQMPKTMESFQERSLLRRIYRSFTAAEARELCQGTGPFLQDLPDDKARQQAVQAVQRLHRKSWPTEPSPWRLRHDAFVRVLGAERGGGRAQGRRRGRGRGAGHEQ